MMTKAAAADSTQSPVRLAFALLALVLGFALLPRLFARSDGAGVGKAAPDFDLKVVLNELPGKGDRIKLSELRGQAVVLDFWATWCGPCRAEAPIVNGVATRFRDQGLVVVGVNTSEEDGNARPWALEHGLTFPIVYDANQRAAQSFGVDGLPTLVVISRTGSIVAFRTGVTSASELEALVTKALM